MGTSQVISEDKKTILHCAFAEMIPIIPELIQLGADINAKDNNGTISLCFFLSLLILKFFFKDLTPLATAIAYNQTEGVDKTRCKTEYWIRKYPCYPLLSLISSPFDNSLNL